MAVGNDDFIGGTDYVTLSRVFPTIIRTGSRGASGTTTIYTVPANTRFYLVWARVTAVISGGGGAGLGVVIGSMSVDGSNIIAASCIGRNVGATDYVSPGDHEYLNTNLPIKFAAGSVFAINASISAAGLTGSAETTIIGWEEPG